MRVRGFTLMEAAIALAMVGIVSVAALSLYGGVIRVFANTRKTVALTDRGQSMIDYLTHELRSVGGNGIPASQGLFVEDSAGCRGDCVLGFPDGADSQAPFEARTMIPGKADRLTIFSALKDVPACPVSAATGLITDNSGTASFVLQSGPHAGLCCFSTGSGAAPFERTVILARDGFYRAVLLQNNTGTCTFKWQDVVPASMRTLPDASAFPTPDMASTFVNGLAVLVDFRTIYLDPTSHELIMHMDRADSSGNLNGFGANPTVAGKRLRILDGVYDFQVSLGYDLDYSGDVGADEWLYDSPGETPATLPSPLDATRLRLVRVEAVVGLKSDGPSAGAPVSSPARSDAPFTVPHVSLRAVGNRLAPRNVDLPTFN